MDEREERVVKTRSTAGTQQNKTRRRPRRIAGEPEDTRMDSNRIPPSKRRKKSRRARRRRRNMLIRMLLVIILIIVAVGGLIFWKRYGSSNEKANLEQYYGMTGTDDIAVIVNNQVIAKADNGEYGAGGRLIDGQAYIEYSVLHDFVNKRFYWDANENLLLYTLPQGSVVANIGSKEYTEVSEQKSEEYVIWQTVDNKAYVALDFVKKYTNMECKEHQDPNRVMIVNEFGKTTVAEMKRDTQVRFQGGVKSPILTEVKKSEKVTVIEDEDGWKKVRTSDGFIGYVQTNSLKHIKEETISSSFEEPQYTGISKDYKINMAWHQVTTQAANANVAAVLGKTKGVNVISPTWFYLNDNNGGIMSLCSQDYVNYCHQQGIEVWGLVSNLENQDVDDTSVFSLTSSRDNLVNNLVAEAIKYDLDGINLDFELLPAEAADGYLEFIRELSIKCENNDLVLSVDNYVPAAYNAYYDREEQAVFADYIVVMAYDEHYNGSEEGSVASIGFVEQGIKDTLEEVPAEQVILGVPFYTRVWELTPVAEGTDAEISEEDALRGYSISSEAVSMSEVDSRVAANGVNLEWLEDCGQYYAEYQYNGKTYKIWVEDQKSIGEKLNVMKENHLAGASFWNLGYEKNAIWDTIAEAMQQ